MMRMMRMMLADLIWRVLWNGGTSKSPILMGLSMKNTTHKLWKPPFGWWDCPHLWRVLSSELGRGDWLGRHVDDATWLDLSLGAGTRCQSQITTTATTGGCRSGNYLIIWNRTGEYACTEMVLTDLNRSDMLWHISTISWHCFRQCFAFWWLVYTARWSSGSNVCWACSGDNPETRRAEADFRWLVVAWIGGNSWLEAGSTGVKCPWAMDARSMRSESCWQGRPLLLLAWELAGLGRCAGRCRGWMNSRFLSLPCGKLTSYNIMTYWKMARNSGFVHWTWWFSIVMLVIPRGEMDQTASEIAAGRWLWSAARRTAEIDDVLGFHMLSWRSCAEYSCAGASGGIQDPVECVKHGVSKVASSWDYQPRELDQHGSSIVNLWE